MVGLYRSSSLFILDTVSVHTFVKTESPRISKYLGIVATWQSIQPNNPDLSHAIHQIQLHRSSIAREIDRAKEAYFCHRRYQGFPSDRDDRNASASHRTK